MIIENNMIGDQVTDERIINVIQNAMNEYCGEFVDNLLIDDRIVRIVKKENDTYYGDVYVHISLVVNINKYITSDRALRDDIDGYLECKNSLTTLLDEVSVYTMSDIWKEDEVTFQNRFDSINFAKNENNEIVAMINYTPIFSKEVDVASGSECELPIHPDDD